MRALGMTFYRRLEWYEREFGAGSRSREAGVPLECGFLDLDEAIEWCAVHPHLDPATVRRRFAAGDRCHGSRTRAGAVTASWISTGIAGSMYLGITVPLPDDASSPLRPLTCPDLS